MKTILRKIFLAFITASSLIAAPPVVSATPPPPKEVLNFPVEPGMTELCDGRVTPSGPGAHITWQAMGSTLTPEKLIAWYRKKLGDKGFEKTQDGGVWRRQDATVVAGVLSIHPIQTEGPHSQCRDKVKKGTKAVAIFSARPALKKK